MWYWIGEGQLPLFLAPAKNLVNRLGQKRLCCSNITSWISTVECTTQYIVKVKSSRQCLLMCTKALHQSQHTPWVKNVPHYQVWNCANMPFLPPYSYELHYCYNVFDNNPMHWDIENIWKWKKIEFMLNVQISLAATCMYKVTDRTMMRGGSLCLSYWCLVLTRIQSWCTTFNEAASHIITIIILLLLFTYTQTQILKSTKESSPECIYVNVYVI